MGEKIKIAVVTGSRAEYGLLHLLMKEIETDPNLELKIIVTGMHLSPEFNSTYQCIENDGFHISEKVEMLLSSDSSVGTAKSVGLGVIGFADTFSRLSPDIIILLGDRFELLAAAQTALMLKIPVAHIHGGEITEGAIDDAIRHAITKMSHLHFVAAEPYRNRVIQMGENPLYVFNVGYLAGERISKMKLLDKPVWQEKHHFELGKINFLITYHPATLVNDKNTTTINAIFSALDHFPDAKLIFTKSNADEQGRYINMKIDEYVNRNRERAIAFTSLGDLNYLSLIQFVNVVIGNSSSGLTEVSYFQKPTVNIGDRQTKRLRPFSVIDCDENSIYDSINKALSAEFQEKLINTPVTWKHDNVSANIKNILTSINLKDLIIKKFNDLDVTSLS